jgi:hypothetical protein
VDGAEQVALLVTGDPDDPAVACVSIFVQPDGSLGSAPVFRTPDAWGAVNIAGYQIIPSAEYLVRAVCGSDGYIEYLSPPAHATTWVWGDVDNNGQVYIDDVQLVLDGADGVMPEGVMLENLDLAPCRPDRIIDADDEADVWDAFVGAGYGCDAPCWTGQGLDDLLRFLPCMAGPDELAVPGCEPFESDGDGDVDLMDFGEFQRVFGGLQDGSVSTPFSGR